MFDFLFTWLDAMGQAHNHPLVLLVLGGAPVLEYLFPPFPGDSLTLLGAVLVSAYQWNLAMVFLLVMLGSILGSALAFALGLRWRARRQAQNRPKGSRLDRLVARFERHGSWYLVLNRFVPGLRPLFFVAAGLAGMGAAEVMLMSGISALLWNSLLFAGGMAVGDNLERLQSWLTTYSTVAWVLMVVAVLALLLWQTLRRRT